MRSASIKRAAQATVLDNLCAAKQDFKPRSELGFLPVENGQTGLSAPKIEAPAVKRELPRDRSKAELRVIGTGIARPSSYPVGSTDPNHDPGHPGGAAPRWRHHSE